MSTKRNDDHMPTAEEIEVARRKREAREAEKNPEGFRAKIWGMFNRGYRQPDQSKAAGHERDK